MQFISIKCTSDLPGTTAVPQRLVRKILNGDFVDMSKLLPDSWRVEEMNTQSSSQRGGPCCGLVTYILIWLECFATLALSSHPDILTRHPTSLLTPGRLSEPARTLRAWHGYLMTPISEDKQRTRSPGTGATLTQQCLTKPSVAEQN